MRWGHPDQWQGRDSAERERALGAEVERLREALSMSVYHAENLRRYIDKVPVRDLAESEAGFAKAKRVLAQYSSREGSQ